MILHTGLGLGQAITAAPGNQPIVSAAPSLITSSGLMDISGIFLLPCKIPGLQSICGGGPGQPAGIATLLVPGVVWGVGLWLLLRGR
jgi:hypothetical protein